MIAMGGSGQCSMFKWIRITTDPIKCWKAKVKSVFYFVCLVRAIHVAKGKGKLSAG